jgi:T5SS/PEP-CTERM-associated repeat protein
LAEKIWTNSASGLWSDGMNWSGHSAPDITSFIRITNDNSKTISIAAATPAANLTVQSLTISAPPGATNLVLLSSLGLSNPLVFQTGLEMQDGAAIRITNSALQTWLTNDHINIDGTLTLDSGSIDFGDVTVTARVGRVTSGSLTINGGTVSAGAVTVGGLTNSSGFINLNGGTFNVGSFLSIGRNPGTTGTVSIAGGQLNVPNNDTRLGDGGVGQMTISNGTALLTNLQVGRDLSGTVWLGPGGSIQVFSDIEIGKFTGSTGAILVAGGQLLAPLERLLVGRGGNGQLSISSGSVQAGSLLVAADTTNSIGGSGNVSVSGGSLILSSNLLVGSASCATGQVTFSGGTVVVSNGARSGALVAGSGTIWLNGGTINTDNLLLTNAATQFTFTSGWLGTKATTVANGSAFVVGDGASAATLYLNGGTHSFANGLVISSNATLAGCGTILGVVVNHGTIATNCSASIPVPMSWRGRTGPTNSFSFPSTQGALYTLQYKNRLTDPSWTDILPSATGSGSQMLLRDTNATGASRFYRMHIQ